MGRLICMYCQSELVIGPEGKPVSDGMVRLSVCQACFNEKVGRVGLSSLEKALDYEENNDAPDPEAAEA